MDRTYLAIDPGLTIGYALVKVVKGKVDSYEVSQEKSVGWIAYGTRPLELVEQADVLIIEDFVGSGPRFKEACFVLKMIGEFRLKGMQEGAEIVIQAPAMRKRYLKYAEALKWGKGNHSEDALAHALRLMSDEMGLIPEDWVKL